MAAATGKKRSRAYWTLAPGIILILAASSFRQGGPDGTFDAFGGNADSYHFDLQRNFFPSPEAEAAERQVLLARLDAFLPVSAGKTLSADAVLKALQLEDQLDRAVARHTTYLELRYESDTRETAAQKAGGELNGLANRRFGAFNSSLGSLSDVDLTGLERARPELRRYRYFIENLRRSQSHRLDDEGERILGTLAPLATGWGASLFTTTMNATDFGSVPTAAGDLSVARDYNAIATSPDGAVRRAGYLRNEAGLAAHSETYASILTRTAHALNALARLRGYADYADQSYSARFLNKTQVLALLNALAGAADLNKRTEKMIVDHYRTTFGLDTVHVWDLFLPEPEMPAPRFTVAQASQAVLGGTRTLGERYSAELNRLLDPANGRLDIAPGPYRANRQGFSAGYVGFPSMFFQGTYNGYVGDVVTLAHESGHAVQNMLMEANGVLPRYASGPAYFTESFAGLSELLVLERMYTDSTDRAHKIFFLQQLVTQGSEVFRTAWESLFEQQMFDSVASGKVLRADDLEAMTQQTASRFSIWFGTGSEKKLAWLQPTQFFTRPLYRVNYVYAKLLALRYFDLLHGNANDFSRQYEALLRNGYDAPPDALLRQFVGVSLADPALIASATRVLDSWRRDLDGLYKS